MLVLVNFAEVKVCLTREYCKYVTFGALNASHKCYLSIPLPLQSYGSITTAIVILCYFILVKNRILVWGHKFFLRQICQIQSPSSVYWPCSWYVVTWQKVGRVTNVLVTYMACFLTRFRESGCGDLLGSSMKQKAK